MSKLASRTIVASRLLSADRKRRLGGLRRRLPCRNEDLAEVVETRPAARGYRVVRGPAGDAIETVLPTRYLG